VITLSYMMYICAWRQTSSICN